MRRNPQLGPSLAASLLCHAAAALLLFVVMRSGGTVAHPPPGAVPHVSLPVVWLSQEGLSDGGERGNRMKTPPRQVERPGHDRTTVPVSRPPDLSATRPATTEPPPLEGLRIPAVSLAAGLRSLPGAIQGTPGLDTDSLGPGQGLGDGTGKGPGVGPGVYQLGSGVTPPVPLYKGLPRYTSEAVQARIQGSILVECIVQTSGTCTNARVVRSFEPPFGLDREAIAAAGQWRFRPGLRGGEQVPVLVTIEVAFSIR
jgi:protein TonB